MKHTITATDEDICNMIDGLQLLHKQINAKVAEIIALLDPNKRALLTPKESGIDVDWNRNGKRYKFNKEARQRMSEAQRQRWAKARTMKAGGE